MICTSCRDQCIFEGGMCAPMDYVSRVVAEEVGITDVDAAVRDHQHVEHYFPLDGAVYRCKSGHTKDAAPADVMRAAGMEPML